MCMIILYIILLLIVLWLAVVYAKYKFQHRCFTIITKCPVCQSGTIEVEVQDNYLAQTTIPCDHCDYSSAGTISDVLQMEKALYK
jgi:C4-type Zn-finger protein